LLHHPEAMTTFGIDVQFDWKISVSP